MVLPGESLEPPREPTNVCERQMRDENGFKCHTQSESHVRQMLLIGEDPKKHIQDYSSQFQRDFLQLLRTSHGEKKININHFYQEYIANKEHIHMNATRWPSLTEFAKFLGREGICRVEDTEKGLHMAWIDNSPEALRRQDAIRKKERQDKGDEEREQKLIREQVERARLDAEAKRGEITEPESEGLRREEGERIKLNFGIKPSATKQWSPPTAGSPARGEGVTLETKQIPSNSPTATDQDIPAEKVTLKIGGGKPRNVFAPASKKNALAAQKATPKEQPKKPMSEAERIMKEEVDRKRVRESTGFGGLNAKRQRVT
ncbi:MAG: hypothetical protein M1835_004484 [Candelina submexicana]|nr:MAG: hypothetical protein M1835_004484 [Candelina submexicana]